MDRAEILDRLKQLLKDKYEIDPSTLTEESRQDDIGLDSMTMVDLMLDVEDQLGVQFPEIDLPKNPSMKDIVSLIEKSLSSAPK